MSRRASSLTSKLESARKDLLDLGLHNPLINYRPLKSKGLEVVDELPQQVFSLLVTQGKAAYFLPAPEDSKQTPPLDESADGEGLLLDQPNGEGGDDTRHTDNKLQTTLVSSKLQARLLSTYYAARSSIEEQGVNILYLALGMLEWYESDASEDPRKAPLILVPVTLERSSVRERFALSYGGEDLEENLSLHEKLKEFSLQLPSFPEDEDLNVKAYFDKVRRAVRAEKRWRVDDDAIALGFFSFSKLLMYRDLDPANWPSDCPLEDRPILTALLEEGFCEDDIPIGEDDYLDDKVDLDELPTVVDADSSQTLALLRARAGLNLVVQGPPGTGKSQTIANLIADAITSGKTVLFVSEKMAALEVVKRRLDQIGIGDACLELHSHKANKRAVLIELQKTLALVRPRTSNVGADASERRAMQSKLDDYCQALNAPIGESGVTPYQALGYLARSQRAQAADEVIEIPIQGMDEWSVSFFRSARGIVEELQEELKATGVPYHHPFWGSQRVLCLPEDDRRVRDALHEAEDALTRLRGSDAELASTLGVSVSTSPGSTERLMHSAERVSQAPNLSGVLLESEDWLDDQAKLLEGLQAGAVLRDLHFRFDHQLMPDAWGASTDEIRQTLLTLGPKWWHSMSGQYRAARKEAHALFRQEPLKDLQAVITALEAIAQAQSESRKLTAVSSKLATLFGGQWSGGKPDWHHLRKCAVFVAGVHQEKHEGRLSDEIWQALRSGADGETLRSLIERAQVGLDLWRSKIGRVVGLLEIDEAIAFGTPAADLEYELVLSRVTDWRDQQHRLHEIVGLNQALEYCDEHGLGSLRGVASAWEEGGSRLVDSFVRAWNLALYERALRERQGLARFDRERHERHVHRYQELDELVVQSTRAEIAMAHWSRLPEQYSVGQMGVLMREFEKRRRHLPIRRLLIEAGEAVLAIKPVFMMSPLSVAAYLTPGTISFDVVVFDEASQVKPVDALGALARASQAVVVGDDRQLPPLASSTR